MSAPLEGRQESPPAREQIDEAVLNLFGWTAGTTIIWEFVCNSGK